MRRREDKKDARESGTTPHRKQQQRDTSKGRRELHDAGRSEGTTSVTRRGEVDDVELHATNEVRLVLRYECEMCVNRGGVDEVIRGRMGMDLGSRTGRSYESS